MSVCVWFVFLCVCISWWVRGGVRGELAYFWTAIGASSYLRNYGEAICERVVSERE